MSRIGAKTYSRKQECKTSVQFEHLLADKGNKPSTAKVSVAGVHRWGMTSFTSLRKSRLNGQKEKEVPEAIEPVKRPKLDLNPEYASYTEDPFGFEADVEAPSHNDVILPKVVHSPNIVKIEAKPAPPKPNKFFKSGSRGSKNAKNADFDAVRLSANSNFSSKSSRDSDEVISSVYPGFKNDVPIVSEELYFTNKPNIVDLRYASIPNPTYAPPKYPDTPAEQYIGHCIQPVRPCDNASSLAFDALFGVDLSTKTSNSHQLNAVIKPTESISKGDNGISTLSHGIDNVLGSRQFDTTRSADRYPQNELQDNGIHMPYNVIEKQYVEKPEPVKTYSSRGDSDKLPASERPTVNKPEREKPVVYSGEIQNSLETMSLPSQACSSSQEFMSSQEISSSQSSDRVEDSSQSSKQSSRPKKIFSSSLKVRQDLIQLCFSSFQSQDISLIMIFFTCSSKLYIIIDIGILLRKAKK